MRLDGHVPERVLVRRVVRVPPLADPTRIRVEGLLRRAGEYSNVIGDRGTRAILSPAGVTNRLR
jgi:hypothetical protein